MTDRYRLTIVEPNWDYEGKGIWKDWFGSKADALAAAHRAVRAGHYEQITIVDTVECKQIFGRYN